MTDLVFYGLELIGTAAFASAGAMTAIRKNMDCFGVALLGLTTAVGGGMMRDLFIGRIPPAVFSSNETLLTAFCCAMLLFLLMRSNSRLLSGRNLERYNQIVNLLDAVGLAAFTVAGTQAGIAAGYAAKPLFLLFLGVLTGVGGGILSDILSDEMPRVLCKHVYALASLAGSALYLLLCEWLHPSLSTTLSCVLIVGIRLLASHFRWNLPHARPDKTGL